MVTDTKPLPATPRSAPLARAGLGPDIAALVAFGLLFYQTLIDLAQQWWNNPDAGHGLLLVPVCLFLAYRKGRHPEARADYRTGTLIIAGAVLMRYVGTMAGELFTMRVSLMVAIVGLTVCWAGLRQVIWWWLPLIVGTLAIPLPALLTNALAVPLQLVASRIGASLLEWRQVPFRLAGNVIDIPGYRLFVAEACSGLRSLTALLSLGVLIGGLWLRTWPGRAVLLALTIPVAVLLNGFRVFLTAFLMHYVGPEFGRGFMHVSEGWLIFAVAFGLIGLVAFGMDRIERFFVREAVDGAV
ncbi:MAG: exosortase/archaeosortase family protein [Gemmatimonadales bacterium]